jgi:hypothetical protein
MKPFYLTIILSLIFLSCETEDNSEVPGAYKNTSIYVMNSCENHEISIQIDTCSFNVVEYNVFPNDKEFRNLFRCPTLVLTKAGTALVACDNRDINNDKGDIDILLARKEKNSSNWTISKVFLSNSRNGRSMSPQFLVDESINRIYLFVDHFKNNNMQGLYNAPDGIDYVYKYSDDDGLTWSEEYSLSKYWEEDYNLNFSVFDNNSISTNAVGQLWNTQKNDQKDNGTIIYCASCTKGITTNDGTSLLPCEMVVNSNTYSCLLISNNGNWRFSQPTPNIGDNECTVYLDNEHRIILDCRTLQNNRHKYYYNMEKDSFVEITPSQIDSQVAVSTEIVNDCGLFYMCFPDSPRGERENITFYGSKDGVNWRNVYLMKNGHLGMFGYSSIAKDNQQLMVCYETPQGIFVQDISMCRDIIRQVILQE